MANEDNNGIQYDDVNGGSPEPFENQTDEGNGLSQVAPPDSSAAPELDNSGIQYDDQNGGSSEPYENKETSAPTSMPEEGTTSPAQPQPTDEATPDFSDSAAQGNPKFWQKPVVNHDDSPEVKHAGKLKSVAQVLAGGPNYTYKVNDKGEMEKTEVPLTTGQIAMGILASVLGGMGAGLSQRGPGAMGRSIQGGMQSGLKQADVRNDADKERQQTAKGDFARKMTIMENNFRAFQNAHARAKLGADFAKSQVDNAKPIYAEFDKLGAIKDAVWGDELQARIAKDPTAISMENVVPMGWEYKVDPATGKPMKDESGLPVIRTKYAIIDPNKVAAMPQELIDRARAVKLQGFVNGDGEHIQLPKDPQLRAHFIIATMNKVELKENTLAFAKQLSNRFGGKGSGKEDDVKEEGKTKPDIHVADAGMDKMIDEKARELYKDEDKAKDFANMAKAIYGTEGSAEDATSPKGAVGHFQVMPGTAKGYDYSADDMKDKAKNTDAGMRYLKDMYEKFKDPKLAFAAYQGGAGAIVDGQPRTDVTDGNMNPSQYAEKAMQRYGASPVSKSDVGDMPKRLELKPISADLMDKLSEDDQKTLSNVGGFDSFFKKPSDPDSVEEMIKAKRANPDSVNRLKSVLQSKDGKLQGQAYIDAVREQQKLDAEKAEQLVKTDAAVDKQTRMKESDRARTLKNNEQLIRDLIGQQPDGSIDKSKRKMIDIKTATSLRNESSRQIILQEASKRDDSFNPSEVESKMKLFDSAVDSENKNSMMNIIKTGNTSLQHMGQAMSMIADFKKLADSGKMADRDLYSGLNKGFDYMNSHFANNPKWRKFRVEYQTGVTDWMNAIRNNQALQKEDLDELKRLSNPNMPLDNMEESLRGMAETAVVRTLVPEDEKWKQAFMGHHPNVVYADTIPALWAFNDQELNDRIKDLQTGGTLTGTGSGAGEGGKRVGDSLSLSKAKPEAKGKPPAGATGKAPGSDGRQHYHDKDGKDLGPVEGE